MSGNQEPTNPRHYSRQTQKRVRHRSYSASEASDRDNHTLASGFADNNDNTSNNGSGNHGHSRDRLGRFGWVRRFMQSNKSNNGHGASNKNKGNLQLQDGCYNDYSSELASYDQHNNNSFLSSSNISYSGNQNDNVSMKPIISRSNSSKLTRRITNSSSITTINNNNTALNNNNNSSSNDHNTLGGILSPQTDQYAISLHSGNSQVNSQSNSLYVNNPRNGYALDVYSLNENQSTSSIAMDGKSPLNEYNNDNDNHYEASTRQSTKSCFPASVFDKETVMSMPATMETSVASSSFFPVPATPNYTYGNSNQGGFSTLTMNAGNSANYTRSIATSTLNNNDSSSVITLASSSRNVLNRSKSSRRSVETFSSSTIGIPPSSIFERLNYGHPGVSATNPGLSTRTSVNIEDSSNGIEEDVPVTDDGESENDDLYSLNNSLRTHYSSHNNNYRSGNDNNSFMSHKTERFSSRSVNSANE
ncbi:hypothetical protein DASC09_054500 [Saccharomycopsis crataegensis]|uniref:Uncharacterized protein n=1 Tax=Saccharomycopsis crataegensis TaxID=43959 RepID=A0AAV5QT72_9ASCO|nr:hypothetical protein DASC09_054500 [Saccharomycopsis crataegensis]